MMKKKPTLLLLLEGTGDNVVLTSNDIAGCVCIIWNNAGLYRKYSAKKMEALQILLGDFDNLPKLEPVNVTMGRLFWDEFEDMDPATAKLFFD